MTQPRPLRPKDVLGVPVLPPARATGVLNGLRAALAKLSRSAAPPPVQILEGLLSVLDLAALSALCTVGLPDRLTRRTPIVDLAADLGVDEDRLARLLRYSATRGWVAVDRKGRVSPKRALTFLREDHPGGWRAWVEFMSGEEVMAALAKLDTALVPGGDAFAAASGKPFFDWMADHPARHESFDAAMAAGGKMHGLVLAKALDWSSSKRVCDVGGGNGALLITLLAAHPHLEGVIFDLPEVIARAPATARVSAVGGDAFESVPLGCDTYLLVNVLHDWADEDATRMLTTVASAIERDPSARVVVLEGEARARPRDDIAARSDLLMFALTAGGRERTRAEFAQMAEAAGLRLTRTVRLATGDVAHTMVTASPGVSQ